MDQLEHLDRTCAPFEVLHYLTPAEVAGHELYSALMMKAILATPPSEAYRPTEFIEAVEAGAIWCFAIRFEGKTFGMVAFEPLDAANGDRYLHVVAIAGEGVLPFIARVWADASRIAKSLGCAYFTWQTSDVRIGRALQKITSSVKIAEVWLLGVKS